MSSWVGVGVGMGVGAGAGAGVGDSVGVGAGVGWGVGEAETPQLAKTNGKLITNEVSMAEPFILLAINVANKSRIIELSESNNHFGIIAVTSSKDLTSTSGSCSSGSLLFLSLMALSQSHLSTPTQ